MSVTRLTLIADNLVFEPKGEKFTQPSFSFLYTPEIVLWKTGSCFGFLPDEMKSTFAATWEFVASFWDHSGNIYFDILHPPNLPTSPWKKKVAFTFKLFAPLWLTTVLQTNVTLRHYWQYDFALYCMVCIATNWVCVIIAQSMEKSSCRS